MSDLYANPITLGIGLTLVATTLASAVAIGVSDPRTGALLRSRRTGARPAHWRRTLDALLIWLLPARIVGWAYMALVHGWHGATDEPGYLGIALMEVGCVLILMREWVWRRRSRRRRPHRVSSVVIDLGHRLAVDPR